MGLRMPIKFVLSLQDALARIPEAKRPSDDQLEMFASTFLVPPGLSQMQQPFLGSNFVLF
jgi:hypothetical protein